MPPEENLNTVDNDTETGSQETVSQPREEPKTTEIPEDVLNQRIAEALKPIKDKLDGAYSARDEALARVAQFEQKEKEAELERLKEEGKFKEAFEMQLAEEKARREVLEKRNVELTRDIGVNQELAKYEFRNPKAQQMAFSEVTSNLVQDENGTWVHKSGTSISDYVKSFSESEDNTFLFRQKVSSGAGTITPTPSDTSGKPSSLFGMSQADVLKLAAEGKLRK